MVRTIGTSALATVFVAIAGIAGAQSANVRKDIEAANQKFVAAFQKGDTAALAASYTADGEAFPPNGDVVRGREAIQKMWQSVIDAGIASATLTTRDVEAAGNIAVESGRYELFGKDGASVDQGKYIVIWKRQQGQWLLHRDIWNTNRPPKP